ncbi:MAG: type II secretion system inner membrane protein GspF [Thiohalomonadales bacterium]
MGAFEYVALDEKGRERRGVLEGDAARQIRQQIREQGMTPLSVEEVQQKEQRARSTIIKRKISASDLALLTRQWATLVKAGLPVEESLRTVSQQSEKPRLQSMVAAVRSKVMEGHSLGAALADFPYVFSDLYRSTVEAGEHSGHLDVVLERLADYTESRQALSQKMTQALIYPILLTLVAIGVVVGLLTFVVPKIVTVFDSIGQELPPLTLGLIATSNFMSTNGGWLFLFIVAVIAGFSYLMRIETFKYKVHRTYLRTPLISRLVRGLNASRFARTLSIVTASGVPILEGLKISAKVITNLPMRKAVEEAASKVREGSGISKALAASKFFPPMTVHLISSGEASGNIEEMLERAAESQEREMEAITSSILGIFEPVLILLMGAVVLVIVLAILLPIFDMNQLVK